MSNTVIHNKITGNLTYALGQMKAGKMTRYVFEIDMPYGVRYFCDVSKHNLGCNYWYSLDVEGIDKEGNEYNKTDHENKITSDISISADFTDKMIINTMADTIYKCMSMIRKEVKKMQNQNEENEEVLESMSIDIAECKNVEEFVDKGIEFVMHYFPHPAKYVRKIGGTEFTIVNGATKECVYVRVGGQYIYCACPNVERDREEMIDTINGYLREQEETEETPEKPDYEQKYWDAQRMIDKYAEDEEVLNKLLERCKAIDIEKDKKIVQLNEYLENGYALEKTLRKHIDELTKRNHAGAQQVNELFEKLHNEQAKHQKATEMCKKQAEEIDILKGQLKRVQERYANQVRFNDELKRSYYSPYQCFQSVCDNHHDVNNELELELKNKGLENDIKALIKERDELKEKLNIYRRGAERAARDMNELYRKRDELQNKLDKYEINKKSDELRMNYHVEVTPETCYELEAMARKCERLESKIEDYARLVSDINNIWFDTNLIIRDRNDLASALSKIRDLIADFNDKHYKNKD